jgi:hypothetical protein
VKFFCWQLATGNLLATGNWQLVEGIDGERSAGSGKRVKVGEGQESG